MSEQSPHPELCISFYPSFGRQLGRELNLLQSTEYAIYRGLQFYLEPFSTWFDVTWNAKSDES